VALLAGIISAIGYVGFTSSLASFGWNQIRSATIEGLNLQTAIVTMGIIAVVYTAIGWPKAAFTQTQFSG
jgi:SSS family solute:Na+ symporter